MQMFSLTPETGGPTPGVVPTTPHSRAVESHTVGGLEVPHWAGRVLPPVLLWTLTLCLSSPASPTWRIEAGALHHKLQGCHCFPTEFSPLPEYPPDPEHSTGKFSWILFYFTGRWVGPSRFSQIYYPEQGFSSLFKLVNSFQFAKDFQKTTFSRHQKKKKKKSPHAQTRNTHSATSCAGVPLRPEYVPLGHGGRLAGGKSAA